MGSMNLGIYISSLSDREQLGHISELVQNSVHNKDIRDLSIFYDDVDFNPHNTRCGMFNAADLWSFNGNLITTSLDSLITSLKVINNINIFYYHGWEENPNILRLILSIQNAKIICRSEKDEKEIYRLTGVKPIGISDNFKDIINLILGCKDEYKSNSNDVYQTA
jgi:hypothetical protein